MASPQPVKKRLGELLIGAGLIDELQLKAALAEQRKWGGRLGRTLVEMGFLDEDSMVHALSRQLGFPVVDLDRASLPQEVTRLMRVDLAERYGVFPLGRDEAQKLLQLASSDPTNIDTAQELSFSTGLKVQVSLATGSSIERAIRRYYYGEDTTGSATATPGTFGVSEETFDPELLARPAPAAAEGVLPRQWEEQLQQLAERMTRMEQAVAGELRALRALVELLVEKGAIRREEYLAKVRRE